MRGELLLALALVAACYSPSYEGVACGTNGSCPDGYVCGEGGLCTASPNPPGPGEPDGGGDGDGGADLTAPVTTITASPAEFNTDPQPVLQFSCDDPPCTFQCRVDEAPFTACVDTFLADALAEGEHAFEVFATDAAGNIESPPAYARWTLDLTPPTSSIATGPPDFSGPTVTFNFSADEPAQSFECSLDSLAAGAFAPCVPPVTYTDLPEGARTFRLRAIDRAGQTGPATAAYGWTVDHDVFSASIVSGPASTSGRNVTFTFDSTRPGSTFECSLDPPGAPVFADCPNPRSFTNLSGVSHTFYVRAENPVGTFSNPTSQTWTVDATGPTTTISSAGVPPVNGWSNAASLTFNLSCGETCVFECHIDSAAFLTLPGAACTLGSLANGDHTIHARASDTFANLGGTATRTWRTDRTQPSVAIDDPFPVDHCYSQPTVSIPFSSSDALSGIASRTCTVRKNGVVVTSGDCSSTTSHGVSGLQIGPTNEYDFSVVVTDAAGNSRSDSVGWIQRSVIECNM